MDLRTSLAVALLSGQLQLEAQTLCFDPTFGTNGIAQTAFQDNDFIPERRVVIQPDGRILISGNVLNGTDQDLAIARFDANGTPDLSFGYAGIATVDCGDTLDVLNGFALQDDGRIVLAGVSHGHFVVVRLNVDGTLDTSFGTGGVVGTVVSADGDVAWDVAIQGDGKIVVCGYAREDQGFGVYHDVFAVARYASAGVLDASFAGDGIATISFGQDIMASRGHRVRISSNGFVLVGGWVMSNYALARLTSTGELDVTFGVGGLVTTPMVGTNNGITDLALQPDGKIVATGYCTNGPYVFCMARYNADGSLDPSFSDDGKVDTDVGGTARSWSVAIEPDGKILLAGFGSAGHQDFALARYDPSGALDPGFGNQGVALFSHSDDDDQATSVALQSDQRIVIAGNSYFSGWDYVLARFDSCGVGVEDQGSAGSASIICFSAASGDVVVDYALEQRGSVTFEVRDMQGRTVVSVHGRGTTGSGRAREVIQLDHPLPPGIYALSLRTPSRILSSRFVSP